MEKFSPEATFAYAKLVNDFVATGATEKFNKAFEKFMDAYEKADEPESRTIPAVGEIYKDDIGHRYIVVAVHEALPAESSQIVLLSTREMGESVVLNLKAFNSRFDKESD